MKFKPKLALFLLIIGFSLKAASQVTNTQNPVLFTDLSIGHAFGGAGGFMAGLAVSFQTGSDLFTGRFTGTTRMNAKILSPFIPIPLFEQKSSMEEFAVLYGRRFIQKGKAYSFSLGVSHNTLREQLKNTSPPVERKSTGVGLPFEAGIQWFKPRKERFRLYGIFPVGKPTGFGGSIGFKLLGNISRYSYAGLAVRLGIGYHKQYK